MQWQSTQFFILDFLGKTKSQGEFPFDVTQHNAIHIPDPFPVF
jgi:hypothetical protein